MPRLIISAAEASADRLASELIAELPRREEWEIAGIAGPQMRAAGVEALARTEDLSVMGAAELLGHLGAIRQAQAAVLEALEHAPDAVVLIDAPDLHMPIGRAAKAKGIPTIGYVSPQVWAWRPKRTKAISEALDTLLCLFDFEPALYPELDASWVGHPVVDRLPSRGAVDPNLYALLPGSREQEISRMRPLFLQAAEVIRQHQPQARFLLIGPPPEEIPPPWIQPTPDIRDAVQARGALTKAGTVTLELAVMGVPQVVAHRVHPMTFGLGRLLVRGIRHIAMPNILADGPCVPEYLQRLDPTILAQAVLDLPESQNVPLQALGGPGAAARAAAQLTKAMERR